MKVTRLKRGYRIRLSDTEFEALQQFFYLGVADFQGVDPTEEFGISRRIANEMDGMSMSVNEDRRGQ